MILKFDAVLAASGMALLVAAVLAFRVAVGAALILLILAWTAAVACRRVLPPFGIARASAAAIPGG